MLVGCSKKNNQIIDETVGAKPNIMIRNTIMSELYVTEGEGHFYFVDDGVLYVNDLKQKEPVKIAELNIKDNQYFSTLNQEQLEYQKYIETIQQQYLQFIDGHIYYFSTYRSIEGETKNYLNRILPDGSKKEVVLELNGYSYNGLITFGNFYYQVDDQFRVINLNTKEDKELKTPLGTSLIDFLVEEDAVYPVLLKDNGEFVVTDLEFEMIVEVDGLPISYKDGRLLYQDLNDVNDVKVILIENDKETVFVNRVIDFIDNQYVYSSSPNFPQRYIVYRLDGSIEIEIETPSNLKSTENFSIAGQEAMVSSRIIGVIENYLLVIGYNQNKQYEYYLIDIHDGSWNMLYVSDYLVQVNLYE